MRVLARMKLAEALRVLNAAKLDAPPFLLTLVAGSNVQPFSDLLAAYIQNRLGGRRVETTQGLFGDLAGNLLRCIQRETSPAVMLIEWADLDSRLGVRQTGKWGRDILQDVLDTVDRYLEHLADLFRQGASGGPYVVAGPGLPLPPVLPVPGWQMNQLRIGLEERWTRFLTRVSMVDNVRILSPERLATAYSGERIDVRSWLQAGFPYRIPYASALAGLAANLLLPPTPAKGIITDLDHTLWHGIVGEVGPDAIFWDLDHRSAMHGVYQRFLQSLADDGILIGVASKNDRAVVGKALLRPDLLLSPEALFPIEANWKPKPDSIERILAAWNIGPDSVVFIDDSPIEIAEVQAAFPQMHCRLFPAGDPDAIWALLEELNDRFGKPARGEEDSIRAKSLRAASEQINHRVRGGSPDEILRSADGELSMVPLQLPPDPRALELINKTNQFNLNGERYTEAEWRSYLAKSTTCAWVASYRDKFGPLGKIAVAAGRKQGTLLTLDVWVLSCRAFSRRIEHAMMEFLFQQEGVEQIVLGFRATDRNGPLRDFLEQIVPSPLGETVVLFREHFQANRLPDYLTVCASA